MNQKLYRSPKELNQGDTIGVCAPSGAFERAVFKRGIKVLESIGFKVYIPDEIYQKKRYMAGSESVRADVLNTLFQNSEVDAIICVRGGFGALKILELLDYEAISKNPKLFIGFSDITALLMAICERAMFEVIHGPVLTTLVNANQNTLKSFYRQLTMPYSDMDLNLHNIIFSFDSQSILKEGVAKGRLTGGNLTTLCHLTGTPFEPNFDGSILFIEDTGEVPYKIDRMLTQMRLAGMFKGVKGVILGSFSFGYYINSHKMVQMQKFFEDIILETFDIDGVPIISGFEAGHGKTNLSLRFGKMVEIDSDQKLIRYL
ncbi:MAG: LD-carboxypeptidase [Desulfamplus sp.]|nr:LD-carboxypeptidase [Desulfamplus sp.]